MPIATVVLVLSLLLLSSILLRYWILDRIFKLLYLAATVFVGAKKRRINVKGKIWHYLEKGSREKPILLLLHGFGVDKFVWLPYIRALKSDYRIIAPDLPGFGQAFIKGNSTDYSIDGQVEALKRFFDALGISEFHLAGNSMGGLIAAKFCLSRPHMIQTLVLMNTAGLESPKKSELDVMFERGELALLPRTIEELDRLFMIISVKPVKLPWILKKYLLHEVNSRYVILEKVFKEIMEFRLNQPINSQLSEITAPTLIMWGRQDRVLDVSAAEIAVEQLPNSQLKIFENAGHAPMVEATAATAACHKEFLRQNS